jgi:hypothetical protein
VPGSMEKISAEIQLNHNFPVKFYEHTKLSELFRNLCENNLSKYDYNYSSRIKKKAFKEQKIDVRM